MSSFKVRVLTATAILLICGCYVHAGDDPCRHLATVRAIDLLAIPRINSFDEFLPPGVTCTSEGIDPPPELCETHPKITDDQMIAGQRRLLMVSTAPSSGDSWDYMFVFGCVGNQLRTVGGDRFHSGAKIESASLETIKVNGSDQPDNSPGQTTFYWNVTLQSYMNDPGSGQPLPTPTAVRCDALASAAAKVLVALPKSGFAHGFGCYSVDPIRYPSNCEWKATLKTDRMLGNTRRLIDVGDDHLGGTGYWDYLYVFDCVNGRVAAVFENGYLFGVNVDDASLDQLTLSALAWAPHDCRACASRTEQLRYSWNDQVRAYLVTAVHFTPVVPAYVPKKH